MQKCADYDRKFEIKCSYKPLVVRKFSIIRLQSNMNQIQINFRNALPADQTMLERWQKEPHVMEGVPDEYWDWETELSRSPDWREQLIAEHLGRPIGFVQIIDPALEETHYWGEVESNQRALDIWIGNKNDLNKGFGTAIMKSVLDRCFSHPNVRSIIIDPLLSNIEAIRFYERFGFCFLKERVFDNHLCGIYKLPRTDYERINGL